MKAAGGLNEAVPVTVFTSGPVVNKVWYCDSVHQCHQPTRCGAVSAVFCAPLTVPSHGSMCPDSSCTER